MAFMLVIVVADVAGAKFFGLPIMGVDEGASLLGLLIAAFAIPFTQVMRGHIEIEFIMELFGKRTQAVVSCIMSLIGVALFATITWQMFDFSLNMQATGAVTPTQRIPLYPFTYAVVVAFFMLCPLLFIQFLKSLGEVTRK